ncbi:MULTISPECIES: hypothetical protein [Chryseobacterium]|uniref:Uncharacterized protein n=1 Tax=Chryseobacterium piscium TaxID=333702 RepID=A0A3D9BN04_9FLAO|nr:MULTISPECIES: hypothetical protein [Chryseobacterium]REC54915.1 hypothetical protein DRF62_08115 [Chryseobacterium piscium]
MKTKFTFKALLVYILSIAFLYLFILIIPRIFIEGDYSMPLFPKIFLPSIITFSFIMLVFGEIRTKCITLIIEKNEITVKRFFGIFTKSYKISEIEGWKYSHLTGKGGTYEYTYLYKNNNKIIKISQFHHRNYFQVKNHIQGKFKYLGYEKFSYIHEFKEIFK